jgi:hypothetical protein
VLFEPLHLIFAAGISPRNASAAYSLPVVVSYITRLEKRIRELEALVKNPSNALDQPSHLAARETVLIVPAQHSAILKELDRSIHPARHESDQSSPSNRSANSPSRLSSSNTQRSPLSFLRPANSNEHIGSQTDSFTLSARHATERPPRPKQAGQSRPRSDRGEGVHSPSNEVLTENSPAYLGSSSAVGFMSEVYETFKSSDGGGSSHEIGELDSREEKDASHAPWFSRPGQVHSQTQSLMADFVIPPRRIADDLVNHYWKGAHPLQPFIHQGTFMDRYYISPKSGLDGV